MSAIVPLTNLVNRDQRRNFNREAMAIVEELETVNTEFLYHLFDENNLSNYKELYSEYNTKWHETAKSVVKRRKIRTIAIDLYWFSENYKPLV